MHRENEKMVGIRIERTRRWYRKRKHAAAFFLLYLIKVINW